ncbi:histidinol-phosphatase, inositol monophosphatase family [Paracoccus solventivorans]|uniref:Histidinol-phosphatase, inositol monophosphatase family n=1 Tax=Paracoccus solventivorans TaxID=53463 RepID=A0A1M7F319_9RHOB|nr:inositol monophosphatase family protein [Paracoccus solventivorans]SHL98395.1 histidinol-phosphatase, inositol monophosphatase family [Paracoccus solventivorans]
MQISQPEQVGGPQAARLDPAELAAIRATAAALADAARVETLRHFRRRDLPTDNKSGAGFDPVTEADRGAERIMREILARQRPDDAILGEEYGHQPGRSGLTWVLDPVDGTRSFMCGAPTWGVLIGVTDARGPLYGLIDQPWTGERFEGGGGHAILTAPQGDSALAVRRDVALAGATLLTTYPDVGTELETAAFRRLSAQVRLTRYGLDCYAYALLALGQVDLVVEAGLQPHDIVAPIAVIEAAGGIVTDWQGGPAHHGGQVIAAATPALHRAALALLAG